MTSMYLTHRQPRRGVSSKVDIKTYTVPGGGGGRYSLIWVIWGRAAGQGMVFWPRCPEQGQET